VRWTAGLLVLCLVAFTALLVAATPAAAAPKRIIGKLSKPGYDVIALTAEGRASLVQVKRRRFRIRPLAEDVTLHLRAPNGREAGPVVIDRAKRGKRAILGVRAGARLGKIKIRRGWARVTHRVADEWIDTSRRARARKGVPLGAGNFGFVRSQGYGSSPGDRDRDGIPDAIDIAAGGGLVLNRLERAQRGRTAQGSSCCPAVLSALLLQLDQTVNANAATLSVSDINNAARQHAGLQIGILPSDPGSPPELDCGGPGGLSYCTPGGTGTVAFGNLAGQAFPECCDDENPPDGNGTLIPWIDGSRDFFLQHGATVAPEGGRDAEIKAADPIFERVTTNGVEQAIPSGMELILATVPALVAYSDTAGNCAKVAGTPGSCPTTFTYPVPAGSPGTGANGFSIAPGTDGIQLTVTFWRPQRLPIPSTTEVGGDPCLQQNPPCEWVDIGNLAYTAVLNIASGPQVNLLTCPQSTYTPGPNLTPPDSPLVGYGSALVDTVGDRAASPANTFTYSLDVSGCLASHGESLDPSETIEVQFVGTNEFDQTRLFVTFRRP
jgi:hypothetical protein